MTYSEYDDFAWVYNKHWGPYADQAIRILDELLLKDIPDGARILDLCCGTGQLSGKLSAQGYQVIGIDSSPGMLRFARENAPEADFIVQDARKFHSSPIYDSVISTYDSLNHIMSPEGLAAVFGSVFTALKSGGLFLFDLNTEAGYLHNWHDGTFGIIEDDHVCIAQLDYDSQEKIAQFDITIFRLLDGWQRSDLVYFQRCYSEKELSSWLESTGFTSIRIQGYSEEHGLSALTPESERVFLICQKPYRNEE